MADSPIDREILFSVIFFILNQFFNDQVKHIRLILFFKAFHFLF